MKKWFAVILLLGLLGVVAGVLPVAHVQANGWMVTTEPASEEYKTWFFGRLYGNATYTGTTSTQWAFVLSSSSHDDPGSSSPDACDYEGYRIVVETNNARFYENSWTTSLTGLEILEGDTTYYFRFAAYYAGAYNVWDYGGELSFTTDPVPPEECHHYGYDEIYTCVFTDNVTTTEWGTATLRGSVDDPWYGLSTVGWVWDNVSHANPDGWPTHWEETPEVDSDYPDFASLYPSWEETSWEVEYVFEPGTYYTRFYVDYGTPGDYVYGPEVEFTVPTVPEVTCVEWEHNTMWTDPEEVPDVICDTTWAAESIPSYETHEINTILLKLYKVNSGTVLNLYVYHCDEFSWYPIDEPLASVEDVDLSGLTTDPEGEWVEFDLNEGVVLVVGQVYAVVLIGEDTYASGDGFSCPLQYAGEESEYLGCYMNTYDSGENWYWPTDDCLFRLFFCEEEVTTYATLYEAWGYVPSTRPAWYQAWPSILKLLYIAVVLLSAFFVFRRKEKKPEVPDFRNMTGPEV